MHFTPTTFIAKLLAAMQVLMTLETPLSTTMALPVTSKPIESTVENLAWQAWIELPPEQKQQVKSRKVTPKSIFTLPLRVECPEGHKQVDSKCIPIAIGSNDVLIDLSALGLLVGNTPSEDLYDYDDMVEEMAKPLPFGEMPLGEQSGDGFRVELKPPSRDEPLKFNIFENKFNIFHEEPLDDYSSISNEGPQSSEKEPNLSVTTPQPSGESLYANVTAINGLASKATNISKNNFDFYAQPERNYSSTLNDSEAEESKAFTALANDAEFKIDVITVPVIRVEITKQNKTAVVRNDSSIQLVSSVMDTESTSTIDDKGDKRTENDLQTLLKTESLLPLLNHTTTTTLQNSARNESWPLTTAVLQETVESSSDNLNLNLDEEITTTLPSVMEQDMEVENKQEYTRSVTMNPMLNKDNNGGDAEDNAQTKDSTLEVVTSDEPLETTTPIQLSETTVIETYASLYATPSTQKELEELLLQQERAQNDLKEFQRAHKGQKDQHVVLKKSKVQPVKMWSRATEATTKTTTAANLPAATESEDELKATTAETVTPLLTGHNENDNNDRFYYHHLAKQDSEVTPRYATESKQNTAVITTTRTAAATEAETLASASVAATKSTEINMAKELVKGIPANALTTFTKLQTLTTTTTATTEKASTTTPKTIITGPSPSSSSSNTVSESSSVPTKTTPLASQIWSKIVRLPTTPSTTPIPKSSADECLKESNQHKCNDTQTVESTASASLRSNRNSKILRINSLKDITATRAIDTDATAVAETGTTTAIFEDYTQLPSTTISSSLSSSTEDNTYEPYWWLPVSWRLNTPTSSVEQQTDQEVKSEEEQPLLLRFWSAYVPKSS